MVPDRESLAWAAGFFDGEGCFALSRGYPLVSIGQTDRRVLDRFRSTFGVGNVTGPLKGSGLGQKTVYQYRVQGFESTQFIGAMLWNFLSPVKREQFSRVMTGRRPPRTRSMSKNAVYLRNRRAA